MLVAQAKYSMDIFVKNRHPDEIIEQVYKYLLSRIINIVLVGMPGSGKTSIGKAVARRERRRYVDSDAEIVASEGRKGRRIFSQKGKTDAVFIGFAKRNGDIHRRRSGFGQRKLLFP